MGRFHAVKDLFYKDGYKLKQYQKDDFDYIIDIGANSGAFSLLSHIYFPNAKVYAYEPCEATYQKMKENLIDFHGINLINKAFGSGEDLFLKVNGKAVAGTNQFVKEDTGNQKQKSVTLEEIIINNEIDMDKNVLLKIDIEGGEECLLNNRYNEILKKCKHFTFEAHFKCRKVRNFDNLPEWSVYNDWVYRVFEKTHNILYHMSRKAGGYGLYVLNRKEL